MARAAHRGEGILVATWPGADVVVHAGNDVASSGAVHRTSVTARERWPGIFDASLPSVSMRLDVEVVGLHGERWKDWSYAGSGQDWDAWWLVASVGLRGKPVSSGLTVRGDLAEAVEQATLMPLDQRSKVLWSTTSPGLDRAVIAVKGASGGWGLAAVSRRQPTPNSFSVQVDAVRPVPAQDTDDLALAWHGSGTTVGLLGPRAAVGARLSTQHGSIDVELTDGAGTASAPGARAATFLDGSGRVIARAPISAAWRQGQVLNP